MAKQPIPLEFRHQVAGAISTAQDILRRSGELSPMALIYTPSGPRVFPFGTLPTKNMATKALRFVAKMHKATAIIIVIECWAADVAHMTEAEVAALRERDNLRNEVDPRARVESVMVSLETTEGCWLGVAPIVERDGVKTFDAFELEGVARGEGRFIGLLPRPEGRMN